MTLLAFDWGAILTKTGQFILSFSILVVLHELGHFLPARWFGCRVDKFYLFFNPGFSLWKKKIGETEYGLGWIPFGGYVKIAGMVDESMDKDQLKLPPQPYEFRSKPAWQRLIIMLGGVTVNVILALLIFIMITWVWGERYIPISNLKYGLYADSLGRKIGLQDGDRIVKVNDKVMERSGTITGEIVTKEAKQITVLRNGQEVVLPIPKGFVRQLNATRGSGGFARLRYPMIIDSIMPEAPAHMKVLQKGDQLVMVDKHPVFFDTDLDKLKLNFREKSHEMVFLRNGKDSVRLPVQLTKKKSWAFKDPAQLLGEKHTSYSLLEAIPTGVSRCWQTLQKYVQSLKQLFVSDEVNVNDSLGSVFSIGSVFPSQWDWESFWTLTAIFSIILAFMNVLPIPALDGGHALFTIYEMITGRKPSDKFMEWAQMIGMVLLLGLMAYALGLDVWRMFK